MADDRIFGSLVVFGLAARLTPLTDTDADKLIRRASLGRRPEAHLAAPRDLLLRVSRLADDLPEVTDLDLAPVIAGPDGAFVMNARIQVTPYEPQDPLPVRI